ncbi:metallophosphoesterase [Alcaligenaceae bacterium]|nr:metallophosphoesterase [Alcaligenaceae bacterium]
MESPLVLVQITDSHLLADPEGCLLGLNTDYSLRGVIDDIKHREKQIDMLLATGDIAQDGSAQAYQRFLQHVASIEAPLYGLPGNHDDRDNLQAVWQSRVEPVIDVENWRIILLNSSVPGSNAGHLADTELTLLKEAATQARDRHVLVAVHHNPIPMGCGWLDSMTIDNGDALIDCIGQLPNVRCLLWGHVHQEYDELHQYGPVSQDGTAGKERRSGRQHGAGHQLRLIASPSTCVQFMPHSTEFALDTTAPAYRWLKLHANGDIDTGVQRLEGMLITPDQNSEGY